MQNEILKCNWGTRGADAWGEKGVSANLPKDLHCPGVCGHLTSANQVLTSAGGLLWRWVNPYLMTTARCAFWSWSSKLLPFVPFLVFVWPWGLLFFPGVDSTDVCQPMASSPLHHSGLSHLARASLPVSYALTSCFLSLYIIARVCLLKHNGPENSWTQIQGLFIF